MRLALIAGMHVAGAAARGGRGRAPVSSSLLAVGMVRSSRSSLQLKFFSRWPSSTTMYFQV